MEKGVILSYKNTKREFYISSTTKPHIINTLIRRAFHLTSDVKYLRHPRGYQISVTEVFQLQQGRYFDIITEEDNESRERSQNYSQKNMAKSSGRKFPPSQKQLHDSKFFVQDFQLFMSEVTSKKYKKHLGIIFFSSKRKAQFLGKKILRQLVFQFDQIEFFYTLHPIKLHSTSALLGQMVLFTIFKGNKMIMERQFPENLTAAQDISSYLRVVINNGQLALEKEKPQTKPKNLIQVQQHNRSFDGREKLQSPDPHFQQDFDEIKRLDIFTNAPSANANRNNNMLHVNSTSLRTHNNGNNLPKTISPQVKSESPIKSHLTNEISFENEFYQPSWFFQGDTLNRVEKSFLSALIKHNDSNLINFCNGIDLKDDSKQQLNIKLFKVFLKEIIDEKMSVLSEDLRFYIELNQENRQCPVFSLLLRLQKFGNIDWFVLNIQKILEKPSEMAKISYLDIAKEIQGGKTAFGLRLKGCGQISPLKTPSPTRRLAGKTQELHYKNTQIASHFHRTFPDILKSNERHISLPADLSAAERAMITDRIIKNDCFLIENFVPNKWTLKKYNTLNLAIVRQYLKSTASRYSILEELVLDQPSRMKLNKLESFRSFLYFLYKQRLINKKQQKVFFYLYVWNDLNLLAAYEVYMFDRNLEEFVETLYSIDYTYYLQQRYGLDMVEVENFTLEIELQLVFMMLFGQYIRDLNHKVAIEKFIRAGDCTLLRIVKESHEDRQGVIKKLIEFGQTKKTALQQISKREVDEESRVKELKKERKNFVEQIKPVHFKQLKKVDFVKDLIENEEKTISSIFEVYEANNELVEWIESFELFLTQLDKLHMQSTLKLLAEQQGLEYEKVQTCRTDIIKGIYELYLITKDAADSRESLRRAVNKLASKEN